MTALKKTLSVSETNGEPFLKIGPKIPPQIKPQITNGPNNLFH